MWSYVPVMLIVLLTATLLEQQKIFLYKKNHYIPGKFESYSYSRFKGR